MIRLAKIEDLVSVEKVYNELFAYEAEKGSTSNWVKGLYPTFDTAKRAFDNNWLYVYELNGEIYGSVVLNHIQSSDYSNIKWKYSGKDKEILVIHTLCVSPSVSGKGIGRSIVEFAVEEAGRRKCTAIRLDTYKGNKPAASLYTSLGFEYAGVQATVFMDVIPEELIYFETKL